MLDISGVVSRPTPPPPFVVFSHSVYPKDWLTFQIINSRKLPLSSIHSVYSHLSPLILGVHQSTQPPHTSFHWDSSQLSLHIAQGIWPPHTSVLSVSSHVRLFNLHMCQSTRPHIHQSTYLRRFNIHIPHSASTYHRVFNLHKTQSTQRPGTWEYSPSA